MLTPSRFLIFPLHKGVLVVSDATEGEFNSIRTPQKGQSVACGLILRPCRRGSGGLERRKNDGTCFEPFLQGRVSDNSLIVLSLPLIGRTLKNEFNTAFPLYCVVSNNSWRNPRILPCLTHVDASAIYQMRHYDLASTPGHASRNLRHHGVKVKTRQFVFAH